MAVKKKVGAKPSKKRPCTPPEMCDYLERLDDWLWNDFMPSYRRLTDAVCNLERIVIRNLPNDPQKVICPGAGGGQEPPVIKDPPKW